MDLLIKNGTIVTATEMYKADIAVDKEKIVNIGCSFNESYFGITWGNCNLRYLNWENLQRLEWSAKEATPSYRPAIKRP